MTSDVINFLIRLIGEATLATSLAIIAVLFLRKPVRRFFGAQNAYALWILVPASLIAVALPRYETTTLASNPALEAIKSVDFTKAQAFANPAKDHPVQLGDIYNDQPKSSVLGGVKQLDLAESGLWLWGVGFALSISLLTLRQWKLTRDLGDLHKDAQQSVTKWRTRLSDFGPALVGLVRPRLVVPANFEKLYTPEEQTLILAHEQHHLKRGDVQVNALATLFTALFWFNPLMRIANNMLRLDQEIACDEAVLAKRACSRGDYANALLKAQLSGRFVPLGAAWPARTANPLKARITAMKSTASGRIVNSLGLGLVILAIGTISWSAWRIQPAETIYVMQDIGIDPKVASGTGLLDGPEMDMGLIGDLEAAPTPGLIMPAIPQPYAPTKKGRSFIDEMKAAGLTNLSVDDLIALKIHGASAKRLAWLKDMGVEMRVDTIVGSLIAGITNEDVTAARKIWGDDIDLNQLIAFKQVGGSASDIDGYKKLGLSDLDLDTLIAFRSMGISPRYVKALRDEGFDIKDPHQVIEAKAMGVTIDFAKRAKKKGFKDLTLRQLTRLRQADVL